MASESAENALQRAKSTTRSGSVGPKIAASFISPQYTKGPIKIINIFDEEIHEDEIIVSPDGGWGWMVVLGSFMSNVIVDGIVFSFGVMSEKLKETVEDEGNSSISESQIAWVMSLLSAFYCLAGPVASVLANRYGFRVVASIGSGIASSSFALTYLICRSRVNLTAMYVVCGVMGGIGMNLLYTPSVLAVGFYFEKRRALATSICVCGSGIGQFIFGTLTYVMINAYGWRITILIEAGIILACSLCTTVYRPLRPKVVKPETSKSTLSTLLLKPEKSFDFIGDLPLPELVSLATTNDGEEEKFHEIRLGHSVMTANTETGVIELHPEASVAQMNKPLNRDDIYYTGSLTRIAIYADAKKAISGHLAKPTRSAISRRQIKRGEQSAKYSRWHKCCRKVRAIGDLMDFTLLTMPKMMLFMLACFLVSCGFLAPYAFLISIAKKKGIGESEAAIFLSVIGAANTLGRIACGVFADMKKVHPLLITSVALFINGISSGLVPFVKAYWLFILYSILFGFSIAFHVSLFTINLVELVGLDHLTSAFGLLILFQGFAFLVGNPAFGALVDSTGSHDLTFWLMGVLMIAASLLLIPTLFLARAPGGKRKAF